MGIVNFKKQSAKMKTNLALVEVNFEWLKQNVIAFKIVIVTVAGVVIMATISKWLGRLR